MPEQKSDWTLMVYLAGDNNLTEEMVWALKEMKTWALDAHQKKVFPKVEKALKEDIINEAKARLIGEVANESTVDFWLEKASAPTFDDLPEAFGIPPIQLNVVAQFDPSGVGIPTQRYDFQKMPAGGGSRDGDLHEWLVTHVKNDSGNIVPFEPGETNTGNPTALSDFIAWGIDEYPAERYMVVLSGHGSGTTEDFLMKDENAIDSLSIEELQIALKAATTKAGIKKIDILGMDCCFMSMAEVCDSLRPHVDIVIGAEGYEPESGWPYQRILQAAVDDPATYRNNPENMAKMVVDRYVRFYSDYDRTAGRSVDLAAVKLTGMDLTGPLESLAQVLNKIVDEKPKREQLVLAHWEAQTYKFDQFADIRDLCECLLERKAQLKTKEEEKQEIAGTRAPDAKTELETACDQVIDAINACVIGSGCAGFAYQYSHGLSIYFPWAVISEDYKNTSFGESSWYTFLESYVKETRRPAQENFVEENDENEKTKWETAVLNVFVNVAESVAQAPEERQKIRKMLENPLQAARGRKNLLGQLTPVIQQFGGDGGHRYDRSRYDRSRYDRSRYADDRDRWVKNAPVGSGIRFEEHGVFQPHGLV